MMGNEWIGLILKGVQVQVQRGNRAPFVAVVHPDNLREVNTHQLFTAWGDVEIVADFGIAEDAVVVMTKVKWDRAYAPRVQ